LPVPTLDPSDDGCPQVAAFTFSIDRPTSVDIVDELATNNTIDFLDVGNNLVTWTYSDGVLDSSLTFTITVDDPISIDNIAWRNPSCATYADGALYVHDVTHSSSATAEYTIDDGTTWTSLETFSGLGALAQEDTTYYVKMLVTYTEDTDWIPGNETTTEETGNYAITLVYPSATALDPLPGQNEVARTDDDDFGLTLSHTNCFDSQDGTITITSASLLPLNNSLSFSGSDYLPLNLSYQETMSQVSVAAWIKTTETINNGPIISFDESVYFQLRVTIGTGPCPARFQTPDGIVTSDQDVNDGEWHLIVGVYDGTNVSIFVDGYPTTVVGDGAGLIGDVATRRYGYIGRKSDSGSDTFGTTSSASFFKGQIADVAVFEGTVLDSSAVDAMLRAGIGGGTHRWILNNNPSSLSAASAYSDLLDAEGDINTIGANEAWARFATSPTRVPQAPLLFSWDKAGEMPDLDLIDLDRGTYRLNVVDIMGCGLVFEDYEILSGDNDDPFFLWNKALFASVSQIDTVNDPSFSVDGRLNTTGYSETSSIDGAWWQVDLGAVYTFHVIRIYAVNNMTNFRISYSQNGTDFTALPDITGTATYHEIQVNDTKGRIGRFIRIEDVSGSPASIALYEVEVWVNSPPTTRYFYLSDPDSTKTIDISTDGTVDPIAWDVCGTANAYYAGPTTTVDGLVIELNNPESIAWTAEDNQFPDPNDSILTIKYELIDTIPPTFVTILPSDTTVLTHCDVSPTFKLEIPDVADNFESDGTDSLNSLSLFLDGTEVVDMIFPNNNPEGDDSITVTDYNSITISQGYHNLIWTVTDAYGLTASDTFRVYVQTNPFIKRLTYTGTSCDGASDGQIMIYKITKDRTIDISEVAYILDNGIDPRDTSNYWFIQDIPSGSYSVSISVNGCESDPYSGGDVVLFPPDALDIDPAFTEPECYDDTDGSIELITYGGDENGCLHLPGDADVSAGLNVSYASLDEVTTDGTLEAWVYLDTIGVVNTNAGIISKGTDYVLQLYNSTLALRVNGATALAGSDTGTYLELGGLGYKGWYHVAGTWNSDGEVNLYIHNASGIIASASVDDIGVDGGVEANASGAPIRIGRLASAGEGTKLQGFIRNARVWKRALSEEEIFLNQRLKLPVDTTSTTVYCVANFPMISQGASSLQNFNGAQISIPAGYIWQDKAYEWDIFDYTENSLAYHSGLGGGDYDVIARDIFCVNELPETITLESSDNIPPVVTFKNHDNTGEELYSTIIRNTSWTSPYEPGPAQNTTGDCWYRPFSGELDPVSTDACGVVSTTYDSPDIGSGSSLNTLNLRGEIDVTWHVYDGKNTTDTTVTYLILDDENPVFKDEAADSFHEVYMLGNAGGSSCAYTVTGDEFVPRYDDADNCGIDYIINNYNETNSLAGEDLGLGLTEVRWIAFDSEGNSDTLNQKITVIDDIVPLSSCRPYTVTLDEGGNGILNAVDLFGDLALGDNCYLQSISIATNVALGKSASHGVSWTGDYTACGAGSPEASLAVDGNTTNTFNDCSVSKADASPSWSVDLGENYDIKRIVIYNRDLSELAAEPSANLSDFTVKIDATTVYTNDKGQQDSYTIPINIASPIVGQTITIENIAPNAGPIQLAEVEVYGVLQGAAFANVALGKTATMISSYSANELTNCEQDVPASRARDGGTYGSMFKTPCTVTHTQTQWGDNTNSTGSTEDYEWWQINLEGLYRIDNIIIYDRIEDEARGDNEFGTDGIDWNVDGKLLDFNILLAKYGADFPDYATYTSVAANTLLKNRDDAWWTANAPNLKHYYSGGPDYWENPGINPWNVNVHMGETLGDTAQYVRIWKDHSKNELCLAEVEVYGVRVDIPEAYVDCAFLQASPVTSIITAEDASGNISQCDALITVDDNIKPVARAQTVTVTLDDTGHATINAEADADNGSSDNCSIVSYLIDGQENFIIGCDSLGIEVNKYLTVVDYIGNKDSVRFQIIVEDNEGPNLNCRDNIELALDQYGIINLTRQLILDSLTVDAGDNCNGVDGIITLTPSSAFFDCDSLGARVISLTATDRYSNSTTCTDINITVIDTIKPNVYARNTIYIPDPDATEVPVNIIDNGSSDNCAITSMWTELLDPPLNTCSEEIIEVVLWAEDGSGNTNSDTCNVTIESFLKIYSIGVTGCGDGVGGYWEAQVREGVWDLTPLTYVWYLDSVKQGNGSWSSDYDDKYFDVFENSSGVFARTSDLKNPVFSADQNNQADLAVSLIITYGTCSVKHGEILELFPGSGQPATTINDIDSQCYGANVTYTNPVDSVDTFEDEPVVYTWSLDLVDGGGGEINGPTNWKTANVDWTSLAGTNENFTGILKCEVEAPFARNKSCLSIYIWTVTVYAIPDPIIVQIDPLPSTGLYDIEVCPASIVSYKVQGLSDTIHYWSWASMTNATRLDRGLPNDSIIIVQWGNTLDNTDQLTVNAQNIIDCTVSKSTGDITITDTERPVFVFDNSEMIVPFYTDGTDTTQTACFDLSEGETISLIPEPSTGGSWFWEGDRSGNSRVQTYTAPASGSFSATATFTSDNGVVSSQLFSINGGAASSETNTIQAESLDYNNGIGNGGTFIGWIDNGDFAGYYNVDLAGGITGFEVRASREYGGSESFAIWVADDENYTAGTQIGSCTVNSTGSWNNYQNFTGTITNQVTGIHKIYLVFTGAMNLDEFTITFNSGSLCEYAKITIPNESSECYGWLFDVPIPEAVDICKGDTCSSGCTSLSYSINTTPSATTGDDTDFNFQNLPIGEYNVTWTVKDAVELTNLVPYIHTIVIEDVQAPTFDYYAADSIISAGDGGCYIRFDEPTIGCGTNYLRQITATDNCPGIVEYAREILDENGDVIEPKTWQNFPTQGCLGEDGVGIDLLEFEHGISEVFYYARDQYGNERSAPSFIIEVVDRTPPIITQAGNDEFLAVTANTVGTACGTFVDVKKPDLSSDPWATDNCTASSAITVTGTRSDGETITWDNTENVIFPVGTTIINWTIEDEDANSISIQQDVTVVDVDAPTIDESGLVYLNYTYCQKDTLRLAIPTTFDLCGSIDSLRVTVISDPAGSGSYFFTQKYTSDPVADKTDIMAGLTPGDYIYSWIVWGDGFNNVSEDDTIHIELEPTFLNTDIVVTPTTCVNITNGSLEINVSNGVDYELDATLQYSITEVGGVYQDGATFINLPNGVYNYIHIIANGCASQYQQATVTNPTAYVVTGVQTNVWCTEGSEGEIDITTSGGNWGDEDKKGNYDWYVGSVDPSNELFDGVDGGGFVPSIVTDNSSADWGDISGLPAGNYVVIYTDASTPGCPADELSKTIIALDNVPPDVYPFTVAPSIGTNSECQHIISVDEATPPAYGTAYVAGDLVPSIKDICNSDLNPNCIPDCAYDSLYQVVTDYGTSKWMTIDELITEHPLEIGLNTVTIKLSQNGNDDEVYTYNITVYDAIKPSPIATGVSGFLSDPVGGGGTIEIVANTINNGSTDNCPNSNLTFKVSTDLTEPVEWVNSITFDCSTVGKDTSIYFQATDEAGNSDYISVSKITINDDKQPHITKSNQDRFVCSTDQDEPSWVEGSDLSELTLDASGYYDNCTVDSVEYKVTHETVGLTQDWTTGYDDGDDVVVDEKEGNAAYAPDGAPLKFYVGKNFVYFRAIDGSGLISEEKICYTINVLELPLPTEIYELNE
jgi:hypothetical protein